MTAATLALTVWMPGLGRSSRWSDLESLTVAIGKELPVQALGATLHEARAELLDRCCGPAWRPTRRLPAPFACPRCQVGEDFARHAGAQPAAQAAHRGRGGGVDAGEGALPGVREGPRPAAAGSRAVGQAAHRPAERGPGRAGHPDVVRPGRPRRRRAGRDRRERRQAHNALADVAAILAPEGLPGGQRPLVSLFFFTSDPADRPHEKYELVLQCCRAAEAEGLHAVWVPERHFDAFGGPYPNPLTLLGAISSVTSQLQLRAGSIVLPLHNPYLLAEQIGMVDALSNGRLGISVASGWHSRDFVLDASAYENRRDVMLARLKLVVELLEGQVHHATGPVGTEAVQTYPRPRAKLPLWLTSAKNPVTWHLAADMGLNVLTAMLEQTETEIAQRIRSLSRPAKEVTCMLHTFLDPDPERALQITKLPLQGYLRQHLEMYEASATAKSSLQLDALSERDRDALASRGVARYQTTAGLFGSAEQVQERVRRLGAGGITELGCLIDFGLPAGEVLATIKELGTLVRLLRA